MSKSRLGICEDGQSNGVLSCSVTRILVDGDSYRMVLMLVMNERYHLSSRLSNIIFPGGFWNYKVSEFMWNNRIHLTNLYNLVALNRYTSKITF